MSRALRGNGASARRSRGSAASAKTLGQWTDDDVNAGIAAGVNALDSLANKTDPTMIHWDASSGSGDVTETGFAIAAIGAALDAKDTNVSPAVLADAKNAVQWLIAQQDKTGTDTNGSWGVDSSSNDSNYATSIALMALSFFDDEPGAANAIAAGRNFEVMWQNAPPATTGNPSSTCQPPSGGSYGSCGSWTYNPVSGNGFGDGSNTGFGVTGLDFSGGVPGPTAAQNEAWARAVQEISSNPYATQNDGGGSYEPGETFQSFRSSANGTGTILFSFAYDGVAVGDPAAQAAIQAGTDVLDTYEANRAATPREQIYHLGVNRDSACVIGAGCNWLVSGDGGYHYSLFALSKGLGSYIVPDITNPANFYAKVADLLLSEQGVIADRSSETPPSGAWPEDPRDDGSVVGATSFSILALAKAGQKLAPVGPPPPGPPPPGATSTSAATTPAATPAPQAQPPAPVTTECPDTRKFTFALHRARGQRVVKAVVFVNGKKTKTVKGRNLKTVSVARLPQGVFTVRIVATQSSGSKIISQRTYGACEKSKPRLRGQHHKRKKHRKKSSG